MVGGLYVRVCVYDEGDDKARSEKKATRALAEEEPTSRSIFFRECRNESEGGRNGSLVGVVSVTAEVRTIYVGRLMASLKSVLNSTLPIRVYKALALVVSCPRVQNSESM